MTLDGELIEELKEAYQKVADEGAVDKDTLGQVFKNVGEPLPAHKIREICEKMKKTAGQTISLDEVMTLFEELDLNKSKGLKMKHAVQSKEGIQVVSGYEQTASGTVHSVSDSERIAFSNYLNRALGDDPDCKSRLPIDPNTDELYQRLGDGIIFCKIVNVACPGTIDDRTINTKKINTFTSSENLTLALNSSAAIGIHVVNIEPKDILDGRKHLILGLLWQLVRLAFFKEINLHSHPNLLCMLRPGETPEELLALSPEDLLLRWVNYQIAKVGCPREVTNFGPDFKDSVVYASLEQVIMNDKLIHQPGAITGANDHTKRGKMVIDNAKNAGITAFVTPYDIVSGNVKLTTVFIANMFNMYPCLEAVEGEIEVDETREEKTYRNWMNSQGVKPFVNHLYRDTHDGTVILQLLKILQPDAVDLSKVNQPPFKANQAMIKACENCNYAVTVSKQLGLSLVGTSGQDIAKSNKTLALGMIWQLMSRSTLQMLQKLSGSSKPMSESEIIQWVNEKIASGEKKIKISSFKDPLVLDSSAILALVDSLKPGSVDWSIVKSGSDEEDRFLNAKFAVSMSRKIGGRVYTLPEDIIEGKSKMIMTLFACLMTVDYQKK